jgi:outer membrane protein
MEENMKKNNLKYIPLLLMTLICLSLPASLLAADVTVGAGLAAAPDYEGSEDFTAAPLLMVNAKWEDGYFIKFMGNRLRANVMPSNTWSVGPVLQFRGERNDDVNNNKVADMKKIDATMEAGVFGGFNAEGWDASLQWVTDTSDKHDGYLTTFDAGYSFPAVGLNNRVGISTTYADKDYMDTYFSVDKRDADHSGLDRYKADSGLKDFGINLTSSYAFGESWGLTGLLKYTALLNDAKDSPIVDDEGNSNQFIFGVMATYKF